MNIAREILEKHLKNNKDQRVYLKGSALTYEVVLDAMNEAINYTRCCVNNDLNKHPVKGVNETILISKEIEEEQLVCGDCQGFGYTVDENGRRKDHCYKCD